MRWSLSEEEVEWDDQSLPIIDLTPLLILSGCAVSVSSGAISGESRGSAILSNSTQQASPVVVVNIPRQQSVVFCSTIVVS